MAWGIRIFGVKEDNAGGSCGPKSTHHKQSLQKLCAHQPAVPIGWTGPTEKVPEAEVFKHARREDYLGGAL